MSSKSRSSSKLLNKRLEDIWSHWSPRHSGKTTQSLLLIMETVAASLGLKITLKISLLLHHYFLGLLPFAAPTWNCYRTITVCSSTSGSNKKNFCCGKESKVWKQIKKKTLFAATNAWRQCFRRGKRSFGSRTEGGCSASAPQWSSHVLENWGCLKGIDFSEEEGKTWSALQPLSGNFIEKEAPTNRKSINVNSSIFQYSQIFPSYVTSVEPCRLCSAIIYRFSLDGIYQNMLLFFLLV